ncbi:MAG: hypothetical protein KatS3mg038_3007 [Candidatus Kapaibacterium sp.]|jgi:hypothetical protein|nr:MAG: hypothetical protein KatS3mg038_3007 [Candidatus Kapabacteria bacterium]
MSINYDDIKLLLPSHIKQLLDRDAALRASKIEACEEIVKRWRNTTSLTVEAWMLQPIAWVIAYLCDLNAGQLTPEYAERSQRQYQQAREMLLATTAAKAIGTVGQIEGMY